MRKKKAFKYTRKKLGELSIFAGLVLVGADIYLGWQDGVWNRYPLSMLAVDTTHFMGQMMGSMLPLFEKYVDMWKSFEISDFLLPVQLFLDAMPMAIFFLISGYFFLKWPKFLSRT